MANGKKTDKRLERRDWNKLVLELLVVFLGVTAGFIMNSWRTNVNDQRIEQQYLHGFLQDVEVNIPELDSSVISDSIWIMRSTPMMEMIAGNEMKLDSAISVLGQIIEISKMSLQTSTYEDITNSGNLNLIQDFKLRNHIVEYHLSMESVTFIDNWFYEYFGDYVMPFIFSEVNVLTGEFNNPELLSSHQFSNLLAGYYSMVQQRRAAYKELLDASLSFRELLEEHHKD